MHIDIPYRHVDIIGTYVFRISRKRIKRKSKPCESFSCIKGDAIRHEKETSAYALVSFSFVDRDSKSPAHREAMGNQQSGGLLIRAWESPKAPGRSPWGL